MSNQLTQNGKIYSNKRIIYFIYLGLKYSHRFGINELGFALWQQMIEKSDLNSNLIQEEKCVRHATEIHAEIHSIFRKLFVKCCEIALISSSHHSRYLCFLNFFFRPIESENKSFENAHNILIRRTMQHFNVCKNHTIERNNKIKNI